MIRIPANHTVNRIFICVVCFALIITASQSTADRIILKDGTVEQSDRVWESEDYVHFILEGTQGVEIRYAKEIVSRIERQRPEPAETRKTPKVNIEDSGGSGGKSEQPAPEAISEPVRKGNRVYEQLARKNQGLQFYDPRRPMRYWAAHNSKYKDLAPALASLAKRYHRTAGWVETHMGQENDLGRIHGNLARQFLHEAEGRETSEPQAPEQKKNETSLGDKAAQPKQELDPRRKKPAEFKPVDAGVRFYDPRRDEKYWSSQMTRHHTLKDALTALARQYGVTPSWIEVHMGDTNDLATIHSNIQRNLEQH